MFKTNWQERVDFLKDMKYALENGLLTLSEARRLEYEQIFE